MKRLPTTKIGKKISRYFKYLLIYLTVAGLFSFTQFIIEEAQQQIIWGTWPAKDSKNYELVLEGADLLRSLNTTMWWLNWTIGYIQPLALLSYHSYWRSTKYYIKSLDAMIFANSPETFDGRYVEFMFTPQKIIHESSQIVLVNRKIRVVVDKMPSGIKKMEVKGVIRVVGETIIVEKKQ